MQTRICPECKRRIRVRFRKEQHSEHDPGNADYTIIETFISFYNHRNGKKLCKNSHKESVI